MNGVPAGSDTLGSSMVLAESLKKTNSPVCGRRFIPAYFTSLDPDGLYWSWIPDGNTSAVFPSASKMALSFTWSDVVSIAV